MRSLITWGEELRIVKLLSNLIDIAILKSHERKMAQFKVLFPRQYPVEEERTNFWDGIE